MRGIPRCGHGLIILGCPDDDCPEQNAYLDRQNAAMDAWYQRQRDEARRLVLDALLIPGMGPSVSEPDEGAPHV